MDRNWVIWDVFELLRVYADISWHPEEAGASAAGSRPAGGGIWAAGAGLAVPRSRLGRALPDAVTEIACHLATIEPYKASPEAQWCGHPRLSLRQGCRRGGFGEGPGGLAGVPDGVARRVGPGNRGWGIGVPPLRLCETELFLAAEAW